MDLWLLLIIPVALAALLYRRKPSVAEVHSWYEAEDYRMLLVLNGTNTILHAGAHVPEADDESLMELAGAIIRELAKRVQFTSRTVFIPEGRMGLNGYPTSTE